MESKSCTKCKTEKLFSEYSPRKAGKLKLNSWCKECVSNETAVRAQRTDREILRTSCKNSIEKNILKNTNRKDMLYSEENLQTLKQCTKCKKELPRSLFNKSLGRSDGFISVCVYCTRENGKRLYALNIEANRQEAKKYMQENSEMYRQAALKYYHSNKEECREKNKQWTSRNPGKIRAKNGKRRAAELASVPLWADLNAIKQIYKRAVDLTNETGIKYHVDHIIPLQGKLVSGLHVENNLQVITAAENMSKHNKFIEDLL